MSIAFFDFDGTLIQQDSTTLCAWPSVRSGLLKPGLGLRMVASFGLTQLGLWPRDRTHRLAFQCYRGLTRELIDAAVARLYEAHVRPAASPAMRALVEQHRAAGDRLVIATAAAEFFPRPLAAELGFEAIVGTRVRFTGDTCTGDVEGAVCDGEEKRERARTYAAEHGVSLEECTFYSDSISDLPLLAAVGHPVAVAPSAALRKEALARGWPVLEHEDAPSLEGARARAVVAAEPGG